VVGAGVRQHSNFRRYFDDVVEQILEANAAVQDVMVSVANPPNALPFLPAAAWELVGGRAGRFSALFAVGMFPPRLRARIGLSWTPEDQRGLEQRLSRLRTAFVFVPWPLSTSPAAVPYLIRARFATGKVQVPRARCPVDRERHRLRAISLRPAGPPGMVAV
jgi:uncharacterized protein (DUF2236 family)